MLTNELIQIPLTEDPSSTERAVAFESAIAGKRYIEFRYVNQLATPQTPSAKAARADTKMIGPLDEVKGYLCSGAVFWAKTTRQWCVRVCSINRKVKSDAGYYSERHNLKTNKNYKKGEHLWRTCRLVGVKLETCLVGAGRNGKVRLFPSTQRSRRQTNAALSVSSANMRTRTNKVDVRTRSHRSKGRNADA